MARPCKPASVLTDKSQTKAEIEQRDKIEKKIRGDKVRLSPPSNLTDEQKKIFKRIVSVLKDSEILGNLDVYLLETTAIAIDRLHKIEQKINYDINLLSDSALMSAKDKYTKDFFRCCNELGLSPQSRAKFANMVQSKTEDPLLKALNELNQND